MTRTEWVDHPLRKNGFTPFHAEPRQIHGRGKATCVGEGERGCKLCGVGLGRKQQGARRDEDDLLAERELVE